MTKRKRKSHAGYVNYKNFSKAKELNWMMMTRD